MTNSLQDLTTQHRLAIKQQGLAVALEQARAGDVSEKVAREIGYNAEAGPIEAIKALAGMAGKGGVSTAALEKHLKSFSKNGPVAREQLVVSVLGNDFPQPSHVLRSVFHDAGEEIVAITETIAASAHPERADLLLRVVREHESMLDRVQVALEAIATPEAQEALLVIAERHHCHAQIFPSLARIGTPEAADLLEATSRREKPEIYRLALATLAEFPGDASVKALQSRAGYTSWREEAVGLLRNIGSDAAIKAIGEIGAAKLSDTQTALSALFDVRAQAVKGGKNDLRVYDDALRDVLKTAVVQVGQIANTWAKETVSFYVDAFNRADALGLTPKSYGSVYKLALQADETKKKLKQAVAGFDHNAPL